MDLEDVAIDFGSLFFLGQAGQTKAIAPSGQIQVPSPSLPGALMVLTVLRRGSGPAQARAARRAASAASGSARGPGRCRGPAGWWITKLACKKFKSSVPWPPWRNHGEAPWRPGAAGGGSSYIGGLWNSYLARYSSPGPR